jgi:fumarylacetoacetase
MTSSSALNQTHDPRLESWVDSANDPANDFPIQNLPFCVFRLTGEDAASRVGVGIGDQVLNVGAAVRAGLVAADAIRVARYCDQPALNGLMRAGRSALATLRLALSELLAADSAAGAGARQAAKRILIPMSEVTLSIPARIGDYTDFYASIQHATNVGRMFRPDHPLLPNYKHLPIGYHGRASSIVVSGTDVRRPSGQTRAAAAIAPSFGASERLDYEAEVGVFVGAGNALGAPVAIDDAETHLFGLCLVNDWSARDVQAWEYQPLGPFLGKSFATSISPWVVTLDALAPFRSAASSRPESDPPLLPYLRSARDQAGGAVAITVEVAITTTQMRETGVRPWVISTGNFRDLYWTVSQLVAHHTSNGCNLRSGDLLASGTVSGSTPESRGCLLERSLGGEEPLVLPSGERRSFLADGDEVIIRGWCEQPGARRIGFGDCRGRVTPA